MTKVRLTDGELSELFSSDCNSFTDIAAIAGVTRERIRQIYNAKFRSRLGKRKAGRDRQKVCTRKQRAVAKANAMPEGRALEAAIRASEHGIVVGTIFRKTSNGAVIPASLRLRLNGRVCEVREPRKAHPVSRSGVSYYAVNTSALRLTFAFLIVVLPHHTLVIPRSAVKAYTDSLTSSLYIRPSGPSTYGRNKPRVNWWEYAERWDLLGGVQ